MYPILDVTADAGPIEPMGSKPKFWFEHPQWGSCLFKAARPGSGEDWSEKIAERFADALGIPHAAYHMATYQGERGIVTPRLTTDAQRLVHGNEILIELDPGYEAGSVGYRTPFHTVAAVIDALETRYVAAPANFDLPDGVETCVDVFIGYLLLDALIGNTDRHHENWAAVEEDATGEQAGLSLAPTFDHASSMGRNEPLDRMKARLTTNDRQFSVEAYAERARSALYLDPGDAQPLSPLEAFTHAVEYAAAGAKAWCARLHLLNDESIRDIVHEVSEELMPADAKDFVIRFVVFNRTGLESLCQSL